MPVDPNLQKHTLNLRRGDWDYLESVFAAQNVPTSIVVRRIISQAVDHMRAQETPIDFQLGDLTRD